MPSWRQSAGSAICPGPLCLTGLQCVEAIPLSWKGRPHIAGWFEEAQIPARDLAKELGAIGLLGMHLEGYGCAGNPGVVGTGLRLGEVCALGWSDVDLLTGSLVVRQQAIQIGTTLHYGKSKTKSGEDRIVPLAGWVPKALESERRRQSPNGWPSAEATSTQVLCSSSLMGRLFCPVRCHARSHGWSGRPISRPAASTTYGISRLLRSSQPVCRCRWSAKSWGTPASGSRWIRTDMSPWTSPSTTRLTKRSEVSCDEQGRVAIASLAQSLAPGHKRGDEPMSVKVVPGQTG